MVGRERKQETVDHEDVLEVVDDAFAVEKVHGGAEEVPVERLGEAQATGLAGYICNGDDLLERDDLDGGDDDDDVYALSYIKQDELNQAEEEEGEEEEEEEESCGCGSDEESEKEKDKTRLVMWKDSKGKKHPIRVPQSVIDQETGDTTEKSLDNDDDTPDGKRHVFTEEELLIAAPVVLGFAFSEKVWLEFSLSGIEEIKWNDEAFDSLVLPERIKQNLKGLVSSHRFNAARTIDDVIQGKGKGLNVVLHGPPGVGKTLTGESIAEYLRCPLYAVSAGELGTNSRSLEQDLNRIMDITHSWGSILLLDEADVFLEARQPHDIHRNSLVSVFLRLTEYYQGILFLTTNRVETFDEAFQSRIHMGIRYENLTAKARKKIWMHHVGKVEMMGRLEMEKKGKSGEKDGKKKKKNDKSGEKEKEKEKEVKPFTEADYDELSKRVMNGRQVRFPLLPSLFRFFPLLSAIYPFPSLPCTNVFS